MPNVDSVPGKITFATSDSDDAGNPGVKMVLDSSGNVGIGTTNPVERLTVVGTITTSQNQFLEV